jgi:DNA-binding transcriptional MerR regulator
MRWFNHASKERAVPRTTEKTSRCRMQDLVKATGTPKSTILFYLAQGLLPQPERTGPNTAAYDPACVERIRFIRQLQASHRLTLAEIRERLETETEGGLEAHFKLGETISGAPGRGDGLDRQGFCRATGLHPSEVDELMRVRLLHPLAEERFDTDDVAMGRMYRSALDSGIRPRDFSYYAELGDSIVAAEMALRRRVTARLPRARGAAATTALLRCARMCRAYVIDRIFRKQVVAVRHLKAEEPPPQAEPEREPWLD